MTSSRLAAGCAALGVMCALAAAPHAAARPGVASDPAEASPLVFTAKPAAGEPHVRIPDGRIRQTVEHASAQSPTLQQLITRLEQSDVVAYVRCDMGLMSTVSGTLSFVGSGGGLRYVLIRVRALGSKAAQAALIGHELRHAVEVADAASIVDVASFDQEYARIGFITGERTAQTLRSYETQNAMRAGEQIRRELRDNTE